MSPINTYRDAFLRFVAEGMTYSEALDQFGPEQWRAAWVEELETCTRRFDMETGAWVTDDGRMTLLDLMVMARLEQRMEPCDQCLELWAAGWTSENPNPKYPCQSMSLYWRRPPRREGKPGRRFLSTNQAWMALQKERTE